MKPLRPLLFWFFLVGVFWVPSHLRGQDGGATARVGEVAWPYIFELNARPSVPGDFQISGRVQNHLSLMWSPSVTPLLGRTVIRYEIFRNGIKVGETADTQITVNINPTGNSWEFFTVRAVDNHDDVSLFSPEIVAPDDRPVDALGYGLQFKNAIGFANKSGIKGLLTQKLYRKSTYVRNTHAVGYQDGVEVSGYDNQLTIKESVSAPPEVSGQMVSSNRPDQYPFGTWVLRDNTYPVFAVLMAGANANIPWGNVPMPSQVQPQIDDPQKTDTHAKVEVDFEQPVFASSEIRQVHSLEELTLESEYTDAEVAIKALTNYGAAFNMMGTVDWTHYAAKGDDNPVAVGNYYEGAPEFLAEHTEQKLDGQLMNARLVGATYRLTTPGTVAQTLRWAEIFYPVDGSTPQVLAVRQAVVAANPTGEGGATEDYVLAPPEGLGGIKLKSLGAALGIYAPSSTGVPDVFGLRLYLHDAMIVGEASRLSLSYGEIGSEITSVMVFANGDAVRLVAIDPSVEASDGLNAAVATGQVIGPGTDLWALPNRPGVGGWPLVMVGLKPGTTTIELRITASGVTSVQSRVLTVRSFGEVAVDANRDGQIKFSSEDASDETSSARPYRFWVNDDIDRLHPVDGNDQEEDDLQVSPDRKLDWEEDQIQSKRDLEDFTRLRISLADVQDAVVQGSLKIGLKWKPASGTPALKIWRNLSPGGGRDYLLDEGVAQQHLSLASLGFVQGTETCLIPTEYWKDVGLAATQPYGDLLFEACSAGKGQLVITLNSAEGVELCEGQSVWLDFKKITEMYEHWSVGNDPAQNGGAPLASASLIAPKGGGPVFKYDDGSPSPEERKYILYVHGWNMLQWEKERFAETAFKRLWLQGYKGRFGLFSWPTTNGFGGLLGDETLVTKFVSTIYSAVSDSTNYDRGEWTAWRSAPMLAELFSKLNSYYPGTVNVVAHSMGNVVTGEALRLLAKNGAHNVIACYVASQAAVPAHAYDGDWPKDLDAVIPASIIARALDGGFPQTPNLYRNWLASNEAAVGRRINFYNVNDYALGRNVWEANQWLKPDGVDHPAQPWDYSYAGTDLSILEDLFQKRGQSAVTVGFKGHITSEPGPLVALSYGDATNPRDRYEIMAFAAESRSKAVGATESELGMSDKVDLHSLWKIDPSGDRNPFSRHKWHSAQFRSNNMRQQIYWGALLGNRGFGVLTTP